MPTPLHSEPGDLVFSLLKQNTPVCFKAGGPSMTPTILDGETVQIRPVQPADLRCGAILLYRRHERLILHRLVRKSSNPWNFFLTGDAALHGKDQVTEREIFGIATTVQRAGRTLPLNTCAQRLRGILRYRLRPLRRLLWNLRHHAGTLCD